MGPLVPRYENAHTSHECVIVLRDILKRIKENFGFGIFWVKITPLRREMETTKYGVPDFLDKSQKCTDISAIHLKFVKFTI
jgi:hypothetical protein